MNSTEDLTPEERRAFNELSKEINPDPSLEDRTTLLLKSRGLLKVRAIPFYIKLAASITSIGILFFSGYYFSSNILSQKESNSFNYILILQVSASFQPGNHFKEYSEWMQSVKDAGIPIEGEKLDAESIIASSDTTIINNSTPDAKTSGLFLLRASSDKEVFNLVKASPHIKYGGTIEIRRIVKQ